MTDLCIYASRPAGFIWRYIKMRPFMHALIVFSVLGAVTCSVTTQYALKGLVDVLGAGPHSPRIWWAVGFLCGLLTLDNIFWRVACISAGFTFVKVTGDVRKDLFQHLTGHAPSFFVDSAAGTLASRITATSNAVFTLENMAMWNVMPQCAAAVGAIVFVATVSLPMALMLATVSTVMIYFLFKIAAAGKPLHQDFAAKAANVDGEIVDVVGNMPLVKSFGQLPYEFRRFGNTVSKEMNARQRSVLYLERVRVIHAVVTVAIAIGLLVWVTKLWQAGLASTGQVVLVSSLGITVLSATRDLAVNLVEATQHVARFAEALSALLKPHQLQDHPQAKELQPRSASVAFEGIKFAYPKGRQVFDDFNLRIEAGQWIGLIGESGGGKSTLFSLLQRFYDPDGGVVRIGDQDIKLVTQESLREQITVVPQDISMFHRTLLENIRYGRPDATDEEVWEAADAANCRSFIEEMPEGFDTMVGSRGVKLSGGQRQRIAIARAILKNAPILLLDEATSALDTGSEAEVRRALETLMKGRTVIAIAHRVTTLDGFDRLITLENGRVAKDEAPKLARAQVVEEPVETFGVAAE
ncbi:ABC transporter [Beijerinckiaceae bacterium RH CH11]|nr:ABC transporter ATP-binding protein [Beijerinckiaceae bacterium]VVB43336.1 ABC transporter [Beijerinckiaceae bacterium RH AL8]VVB43351.1 ABC transporter [Beijerinckiaceae bacterium RH CH11]